MSATQFGRSTTATNKQSRPYVEEKFAHNKAWLIRDYPELVAHVQQHLAKNFDIQEPLSREEQERARRQEYRLRKERANANRKRKRSHNGNYGNNEYAVGGENDVELRSHGRQKLAKSCKSFPGAIVCSMMRKDLPLLNSDYVALEKTDGTRFLLLLTQFQVRGSNFRTNFAILINRKLEMRIVNLKFDEIMFQRDTMFDGELAEKNGQFTYLIFDLIHCRNVRGDTRTLHARSTFEFRMGTATRLVKQHWHPERVVEGDYDPYSAYSDDADAATTSHTSKTGQAENTFNVHVKHYVHLNQFRQRFRQILQQPDATQWRHHDYIIDGFIFVPKRQTIKAYRNEKVFKFKPVDQHTIDLQLMPRDHANFKYDLLAKTARQKATVFTTLAPTPWNARFIESNMEAIKHCVENRDNFIVECFACPQTGQWQIKKRRLDKKQPNSLHTVQQTSKNIEENITLHELSDVIDSNLQITTITRRNTNRHSDNHRHNYYNQAAQPRSSNFDSYTPQQHQNFAVHEQQWTQTTYVPDQQRQQDFAGSQVWSHSANSTCQSQNMLPQNMPFYGEHDTLILPANRHKLPPIFVDVGREFCGCKMCAKEMCSSDAKMSQIKGDCNVASSGETNLSDLLGQLAQSGFAL